MNNKDYNPQDLMNSKISDIHSAILFMEIRYVKGKLQELEEEVKKIYNKIEDSRMASIDLEKEFNNFIFKTDTNISSIEKEVNFLGELKERTTNSSLSNNSSKTFVAFVKLLTDYKEVAFYFTITLLVVVSSVFGAYEVIFEQKKIPPIKIEEPIDKDFSTQGE